MSCCKNSSIHACMHARFTLSSCMVLLGSLHQPIHPCMHECLHVRHCILPGPLHQPSTPCILAFGLTWPPAPAVAPPPRHGLLPATASEATAAQRQHAGGAWAAVHAAHHTQAGSPAAGMDDWHSILPKLFGQKFLPEFNVKKTSSKSARPVSSLARLCLSTFMSRALADPGLCVQHVCLWTMHLRRDTSGGHCPHATA